MAVSGCIGVTCYNYNLVITYNAVQLQSFGSWKRAWARAMYQNYILIVV